MGREGLGEVRLRRAEPPLIPRAMDFFGAKMHFSNWSMNEMHVRNEICFLILSGAFRLSAARSPEVGVECSTFFMFAFLVIRLT